MAYPTNEFPRFVVQKINHQPIQIPDLRTLSYDEVLALLSEIESDSFDERYSMEKLDQISQFISLLAMEGATEDEKPEMEYAVASLFRSDPIQYALLLDSEDCLIQRLDTPQNLGSISKGPKSLFYAKAGLRSDGIKRDLLLKSTRKPSSLAQLLW
jgi:hypothetical protein